MEKLKEGFPDGIGGMSVTGEGACGGIPFVLFVEHKIEVARHPSETFRGIKKVVAERFPRVDPGWCPVLREEAMNPHELEPSFGAGE